MKRGGFDFIEEKEEDPMKEKDREQLFVGVLIIGLLIFFILIISTDFIKINPDKACNVGQAIGWYIKDLFSPLFGK